MSRDIFLHTTDKHLVEEYGVFFTKFNPCLDVITSLTDDETYHEAKGQLIDFYHKP